jgi:hypothetical protein
VKASAKKKKSNTLGYDRHIGLRGATDFMAQAICLLDNNPQSPLPRIFNASNICVIGNKSNTEVNRYQTIQYYIYYENYLTERAFNFVRGN